MNRDEIDISKIAEKYGNKTNQLANWMRSLTVTDYGYNYLKKEGYSDEQIGPWVRKTPAERTKYVKNKSSPENLDENLLRDGETLTEDVRLSGENGEKREKGEAETLRVPQPEGNKGTVSNEGSQGETLTFSQKSQVRLSDPQKSQDEKNFSPDSRKVSLENLSPEQLSILGIFRDGNGAYFHASETNDGGYHLTPVTQESLAGAVAGVQRQAKQVQQTQQCSHEEDLRERSRTVPG